MNCPSCALGKSHPTQFPDVIVCAGCGQVKNARHNHVLCIECEGGKR